jgi:hypothetical protein
MGCIYTTGKLRKVANFARELRRWEGNRVCSGNGVMCVWNRGDHSAMVVYG